MTASELREQVQKKISIDQVLVLSKWDKDGIPTERTKVKIVAFHPNHVLTEHNGYKECFTYWDILNMITVPERKAAKIPDSLEKKKKGRYY